jgi:hypothetical protein
VINITQRSLSTKKPVFLSKYIPNPKERRTIILYVTVTSILILTGIFLISLFYQSLIAENSRHYKGTFKQIGSISRIGYFAVLSIYPVFLLLKWKKIKEFNWGNIQLKVLVQFLGKLVRKWHVPVALLSTGLVVLHGLLASIRGFKLDFTYLSGIISTIILLFLLLTGLKRFKRKDNKWHFKLAIGFLLLFMIHATFA